MSEVIHAEIKAIRREGLIFYGTPHRDRSIGVCLTPNKWAAKLYPETCCCWDGNDGWSRTQWLTRCTKEWGGRAMRILAIWERPVADPKWGGIFCLTDTAELLHLTQGRNNDGRDSAGNPRYSETGQPEWSHAFNTDPFDFNKADFFLRHFGGQLVWRAET